MSALFKTFSWTAVAALLLLGGCRQVAETAPTKVQAHKTQKNPGTYQNPLTLNVGDGELAESCADPVTIRGQRPGDDYWYLYCTTDPLNSGDRNENGDFNFNLIPIFRSHDLVNWEYQDNAFDARPEWVADDAGLWAPEVAFFNDQYYLYYTAPNTDAGGSAIGVATSPSPTGPWTDAGAPAVEPHAADCCPGSRRWVFDTEVIEGDGGRRYLYYGSYFGGLSVRELSADGLTTDPATQTQVAISNRYEGTQVIRRDGFYYLLASATDCCRGPLTGYSVFAGRSESPTGPFVDKEGVSLLAGRVGGTPVLSMNGNRWVGLGHHDVLTDFGGQQWMVYHAVDRFDPYFEGAVGFTKRPVLMDPLDWVDGWPTVRSRRWASDEEQFAPAAQPGQRTRYQARPLREDRAGKLLFSDSFEGDALGPAWNWVREPVADSYAVGDGLFTLETQAADLFESSNNASVLTRALPEGDLVMEARVKLDVPAEGCCFNYVQAGMVVYGGDDAFIKLSHTSIWETRQTEFAKEVPASGSFPRYGNTVVGPPGEWTDLRVVRRSDKGQAKGQEFYTAYTRQGGKAWVRSGTWTHSLGENARLGLVAMGGAGFTATFDEVRVYRLKPGERVW
jgi:arabinan endo-1,5-alpha-L-arabinosidase